MEAEAPLPNHWDDALALKPSSQTEMEWVSPPFKLLPTIKPLTKVEELQHKAAATFKHFLTGGHDLESACISSDSEEEEEEEENVQRPGLRFENRALGKETEVQKFFEKMFEEEGELRRFYLENFKKGYFECAVCRATGGKVWRIFPDCVGLIQHSLTVLNTKRRDAHRGYGKAISALLGWSVDRYLGPSLKKKLQSLSLAEGCEEKDSCDEEDTDGKTGESCEKDGDKHGKDVEDQETDWKHNF